jgi:hypothetical protein
MTTEKSKWYGAKPPTHFLKIKERPPGKAMTQAGRAWLNEDGSMSIQLNPCIVFSSHDDVFITLFPVGTEPRT